MTGICISRIQMVAPTDMGAVKKDKVKHNNCWLTLSGRDSLRIGSSMVAPDLDHFAEI